MKKFAETWLAGAAALSAALTILVAMMTTIWLCAEHPWFGLPVLFGIVSYAIGIIKEEDERWM